MKEYDLSQFYHNLEELGIVLNQEQEEQFLLYYKILTEWNQRMNLTAITDFQEVFLKHFIDSLSLIYIIPELKESSFALIDVGTGAGFPGLPLKIAFPLLQVTLLDSLQKRVRFLDYVTEELGLEGITAIHGRAEDYAMDSSFREKYDICVSRAVANLSTLSEYCIPFVKKDGIFVSYKSEKIREEAEKAKKAVFLLGGKTEQSCSFFLPGSNLSRTLYVIRKNSSTPENYPRKAGLPSKDPL